MRIRKGDTVKVLYGRDKGKTGRVLKVDLSSAMVVVEGVNIHTKHVKGDAYGRRSEIVTIVKPMPVSKVMLVDADGKPTRVRYEVDNGKKVRVAVRTGKKLDESAAAKESSKDSAKEKAEDKAEKKAESKNKKSVAKKTTKKKTTPKKDTEK